MSRPRPHVSILLVVFAASMALTWLAVTALHGPATSAMHGSHSGQPAFESSPSTVRTGPGAAPGNHASAAQRDASAHAIRHELAAGDLRVTGRVVGRGEPLQQASVALLDPRGNESTSTSTDRAGGFALSVANTPTVALLVQSAGFAPRITRHTLLSNAAPRQLGDIELRAGGTVAGRITGTDGRPVAGATATLVASRNDPDARAPALLALRGPRATSADGTFRFEHVMAGTYRVTARAPGHQEGRADSYVQVTEGSTHQLDAIALSPGTTLRGRVVDPDGTAIGGATIRVRSAAAGVRLNRTASSSPDGRFALHGLPPGALRVSASAPGYLHTEREAVDATQTPELLLRLERGMTITGVVRAAGRQAPIESFAAALSRVGSLQGGNGDIARQLSRKIDAIRASAATTNDAENAQRDAFARALQERLTRVREQHRTRPAAAHRDLGSPSARPGGEFAFPGIDEGIYLVEIDAPGFLRYRSEPLEVRRGAPCAPLRVELQPAHRCSGTVVWQRDGTPVEGVVVELMHVVAVSATTRDRQRSPYPWAFPAPGPTGVPVVSVRTDRDGSFRFDQVPAGPCFLAVRHPGVADLDTEPFLPERQQNPLDVRVTARSTVRGRVRTMPTPPEAVHVLALGGHGTLRVEQVAADGSFALAGLQPGSYLLRAFRGDRQAAVRRTLAGLFAPHAAAAEEQPPPADLELRPGEDRSVTLDVDEPPSGVVTGSCTHNGVPGKGCRIVLRPVTGSAPAAALTLRTTVDDAGGFTLREAAAGRYTLHVYSKRGQELDRRTVEVATGTPASVRVTLSTGALRGTVLTPDGSDPASLRGSVFVLPGATAAPADLIAFRRGHRNHRLRLRGGRFADDLLSAGPALLWVEVPGREPATRAIEIPVGAALDLELTVGRQKQE